MERRGRPVAAIVPLSDLPALPESQSAAPLGRQRRAERAEPGVRAAPARGRAVPGPDTGSILDVLGCGGPEADELCKLIDEVVEQRSLDTGRPVAPLQ